MFFSVEIDVITCSFNISPLQYGRTPVYCASQKGNTAVVELLIENGADVTLCDKVYSPMREQKIHSAVI